MPSLELDSLRLLVVVDNETDTLSSVDGGVPQVPELGRLLASTPVSRTTKEGHACHEVFEHLCVACHGFSVLASARRGAEEHTILFDVGPHGSVWRDNAARLRIDLATIEAIFLSHWHADHSAALPDVVTEVAAARKRAGCAEPVLVDLHPARPDQRGILTPTGEMILLPPEPTFASIEAAGGRVVTHADEHTLCDGFFLASGAIPRTTEYETGLAGHHSFHGDECRPDPLILDERFVAADVRGRGVSVLSACSHAGVVNAALAARAAFHQKPIDVLLGGYHLSGKAMEARIEPTVRDLERLVRPRVVAPGHCTGWRAKAALACKFAPGRYGPSVVGSMYVLEASA
jgi:7,8-dihydropterin-6-yl-methyl-4-(beta-D-ribofuranosyl)aminobenzene 5'-phosphate synthase